MSYGRPVSRRRLRLLSLGTTFAVAFAAVTATITVLVGILSYNAAARLVRVDQQSVFDEVVQDLRDEVRENRMSPLDFSSAAPGHDLVRPARTDVQVLGPDGGVLDPGDPGLPVVDADRRVAGAATAGRVVVHAGVDVGDDVYRVATVALGGGRGAVQVAQEFSDTEDLLRALQRRTLILMAAVVVGTGLFGWWLARRITRRLVVLTNTAEAVARTRRLGIQVPVAGYDEVGRLGRAFDRMLGRLAQSEEDQRRLVQDAGHELRTPLTSLRTNISLLRRIDELPPGTREELVADLTQEARELTDLVNELVELAAGQSDTEPPQRVDLARRRRGGGGAGPAAYRAGDRGGGERRHDDRRAAGNADACAVQPGGERRQIRPGGPGPGGDPGGGPGASGHGTGGGTGPGPGDRRRRSDPHLRPLLPSRRRPLPAGLGPGPLHRPRGSPLPRRRPVRVPARGRGNGDGLHGGRRLTPVPPLPQRIPPQQAAQDDYGHAKIPYPPPDERPPC
ncbi:hypothetical protein SHKM778_06280 [Streptomyces sp. KM77-8]|uniref:histidine kinase n=1 Tax=Streptomyces haneummycinicus TaxID=3074435 RepID=A0AAT9HA48_9ACTN